MTFRADSFQPAFRLSIPPPLRVAASGPAMRSGSAAFRIGSGIALFLCLLAPLFADGQSSDPGALASRLPAPARRSVLAMARRGLGRPGRSVPAQLLERARAEHAALLRSAQSSSNPAQTSLWEAVGPFQINTSAWDQVTGRVTSIAADPSDSSGNTVYLGTAGGGIWKSTTAAGALSTVSFAPLTDDLSAYSSASLTSLSIGAVSVQPGGTGVVLGGTGDPNDATDSWYGAGILRSTDNGVTWSLIDQTTSSDPASAPSYDFRGNAVAGFAWSTTNPDFVVAAVSQSAYGALLGIGSAQAILGLYYSSDAGATWHLATIEDGTNVIQSSGLQTTGGNAATAVVWNPIRSRFYAAVRYHGYYESADGITWTRLQNQPGAGLTASACPTNPGFPGSPACPIFRGALAVQPATGDLFALTIDQNDIDQGLWQDVCHRTGTACSSSTVQFGTRILDQALDTSQGNTAILQGTYNLWLAAVPSQQDTLLFAGTTDIWRCSLANSCIWRNTTSSQTCDSARVAPAQHAVDATFGASGLLYFGNDGGLWRSTDGVAQQSSPCSFDDASHFQNLNGGLGSLAEVEGLAEDPANAFTWMAALGGLGTAAAIPGSAAWNQVLNGEGDAVAIDPANSDNWYATSEFGVGINRCTEGTACDIAFFGDVAIGESQVQNDFQFIPAPWILDPQNTARIILGTCRIWRGPATGDGWGQSSLLSGILDGEQQSFCDGNSEIRSLAAAAVQSGSGNAGTEQIYAGMAGALDGGGLIPGHVFTATVNDASQASTTTWTDLYSSPVTNSSLTQFDPGGFDISQIYIDPHDPTAQTLYVTIQGYPSTAQPEPLLYRSSDGGAHWLNLTANLPHAPANAVAVDPNDANIVYVALDTGVYYTQNYNTCTTTSAICWNILGAGLPNAPVTALMVYNQGLTQVLRAATAGRGIWQTPLLTSGIIPTTATVTPASLVFAARQVQTASPVQIVTVTNTGPVALTPTDITMAGDFTETDNCVNQSVVSWASCQIQVVFTPSAAGARQGSITLFADLAGGQLTVPLSGTGLASGNIALTPSSLSFAATTTGATSAAQSIDIANTGQQPVALSSETVSGDFSITANTCTASLPPQTSCEVNIVFLPTTSGSRTGVLQVVDAVGAQTAPLSGTGLAAPTDALSPGSLSFTAQQIGTTSAPQQVTLTNNGDQALTAIAVSVTGDFTAVSDCGALLQGHAGCSISVAYVPTVTGQESGVLTVADVLRTRQVSLTGTGIAPPGFSVTPESINFGGLAVGTASSPQTVTITNNTSAAVTGISAATTTGFGIASNGCPASLAPGSACRLGITFTPSALGPFTGSLKVSSASPAKTVTVPLAGSGMDFSMAVAGASSAVLTPGQSATFSLQLQGLAGSSGTVALACSGVPASATCTLNPASIAVTSANSSNVTVTIVTAASSASASTSRSAVAPHASSALPLLALLLPVGCIGLRRRKLASSLTALVFTMALFLPAGCGVNASSGSGGSGSGSSGSQSSGTSENYVVTLQGTMANITHSVSVNLTVQ